ncbi:MAG TPA: hypothetical protein VEO01_27185, partial [Pseudonocardiaceae bacterium]|nr:hypothetical protein [Pseudonocardiaceae bacterium]
ALTTAHTYGSERITNRVREFRTSLPPRTTEADRLDDALSALYERNDCWRSGTASQHAATATPPTSSTPPAHAGYP